jgi:hypothetical protein
VNLSPLTRRILAALTAATLGLVIAACADDGDEPMRAPGGQDPVDRPTQQGDDPGEPVPGTGDQDTDPGPGDLEPDDADGAGS